MELSKDKLTQKFGRVNFLVSNFNLSIKLVDKNHIIYNKKATNTQNLFNLMKEKKKLPARLQVGQRGEGKNIANNCKVSSRNNTQYSQKKKQQVNLTLENESELKRFKVCVVYLRVRPF